MRTTPALSAAAAVLAVLVAASGCGGGHKKKDSDVVSAADACGGVLSPAAAKALKELTGHSTFNGSAHGVAAIAQGVADHFGGKSGYEDSLCMVAPGKRPDLHSAIWIDYHLEDKSTAAFKPQKNSYFKKPYRMGLSAAGGPRNAYIDFACVSPEIKKSSKTSPAYIGGELRTQLYPPGKGEKYYDDNMTVLHSATIALVRKLGCRDNADIPAEPDLSAAS